MKGRRWEVTPQGVKIGRADSCEIQVADVAAELFHCVVKLVDGKPTIHNLASDNGVEVNGTNIDEAELDSNDSIRIGNERFVVVASGGEKGGSLAPKIVSVAFLLGLAAVGAYFYRQYNGSAERDSAVVPAPAVSAVNPSDYSVMASRVVKIVNEEIVKTNRVVHIVDNVVVTNYVVETRRGGELVSSMNISPINELKSRDGERTAGAAPDNSTVKADAPLMPAEELPPYEVIDSRKALAMGGASGGDEVRMVVNTNGTCDIIHIFTNTAVTSTLVVPGKNRIVPKSASFLVVAGGGAAGWAYHGSGGAGGVVLKEKMPLEPGTAFVYVGVGGIADGNTIGRNGEDSLLTIGGTTYTAIGGGAAGGCSGGSGGGGDKRTIWDGKGLALQPKSITGGLGADGHWDGEYRYCGGGPALKSAVSGRTEMYACGGWGYSGPRDGKDVIPAGFAHNGIPNRGHGVNGTHRLSDYHSQGSSGIVIIRYGVDISTGTFAPHKASPTYPAPDKQVKTKRIDGILWLYFVEKDGSVTIGCHGDGTIDYPDVWAPAVDIKAIRGIVRIPGRIDGRPVHRIGKGAFQGCLKVEQFIVPEGVTHCGARAFARCPRLKSVIYPKSIQWLGEGQIYRSCEVESIGFMSEPPKSDYGCCPLKGSVARVFVGVSFEHVAKWRNWGHDNLFHCCKDGCHRNRIIAMPSSDECEQAKRTGAGFAGVEIEWKRDNGEKSYAWLKARIDEVWGKAVAKTTQRTLSLPKIYSPRGGIQPYSAVIYVSMMRFKSGEPVEFSCEIDDGAVIMVDDDVVFDSGVFGKGCHERWGINSLPKKDEWHRVAIFAVNWGGYGGADYKPKDRFWIGGIFYKRGDGERRMLEAKPDGSEFRVRKEDACRAVADIERAKRRQK